MSTSLPHSNSHARFQNTLHDMYELARVAKTSYASLAGMLPCCPTNEQGTKRKLCVSLSLDTSMPSHRLTAHVQGVVVNSDGAQHVCWQFEHGPMTLEENDTVQVLRLPRVTATGDWIHRPAGPKLLPQRSSARPFPILAVPAVIEQRR